jgi:hypothetical protein
VLFAVLIYPRSGLEPTVGLSPVAWEPPGGSVRFKGDLFGAKKPGVAVLLLFKGFKKPVPQERVDTLYEALKPTPNLFEQYDFLTPAEVREAVRESKVKPKSAQAILERVARDFHLSRGLVVTISPERDKFLIEAEVMQLPTRTVLKQETWDGVAADQLAARLRDMVSMVDARK